MHQRLTAQVTLESKSEDWRHTGFVMCKHRVICKGSPGSVNKIDSLNYLSGKHLCIQTRNFPGTFAYNTSDKTVLWNPNRVTTIRRTEDGEVAEEWFSKPDSFERWDHFYSFLSTNIRLAMSTTGNYHDSFLLMRRACIQKMKICTENCYIQHKNTYWILLRW